MAAHPGRLCRDAQRSSRGLCGFWAAERTRAVEYVAFFFLSQHIYSEICPAQTKKPNGRLVYTRAPIWTLCFVCLCSQGKSDPGCLLQKVPPGLGPERGLEKGAGRQVAARLERFADVQSGDVRNFQESFIAPMVSHVCCKGPAATGAVRALVSGCFTK